MKTKQMLIIIFSFLVHKTFLQSDEIKSAPTTYISPITQKYINAIKAKKHLMKPYSLNTVLFKTNGLKEDHNVELEFKEIQYTSISGKVIRLPKGFILLYMGIHPGLGKQNRNLDFPPGLYTKMVIVLNSISKVRMIREYRSYLDNKIEFDVKVRNADKIEIEFPHPIEFVNEITTEIQIEYNVQAWKKETQDTYSMELSAKYISSKIDLPFHPGHFIVSSVNNLDITKNESGVIKTGVESLDNLLLKYKDIYFNKWYGGEMTYILSIHKISEELIQKCIEEILELKKDPNIKDVGFPYYKEYLDD